MIDDDKPAEAPAAKKAKKPAEAPAAKSIWKPSNKAFLGTDEEAIAVALGLPQDRVSMVYTPETRDGIKGVSLTGVEK